MNAKRDLRIVHPFKHINELIQARNLISAPNATRVSGKRNIWEDTLKLNIVEYDRISVPIVENALGRRRIYRNTKWHTLEKSPFNALSAKSVLEVRQISTGTSDVIQGRNHTIVLTVAKILDRQVILAGMSKNIQTNDYFFLGELADRMVLSVYD